MPNGWYPESYWPNEFPQQQRPKEWLRWYLLLVLKGQLQGSSKIPKVKYGLGLEKTGVST